MSRSTGAPAGTTRSRDRVGVCAKCWSRVRVRGRGGDRRPGPGPRPRPEPGHPGAIGVHGDPMHVEARGARGPSPKRRGSPPPSHRRWGRGEAPRLPSPARTGDPAASEAAAGTASGARSRTAAAPEHVPPGGRAVPNTISEEPPRLQRVRGKMFGGAPTARSARSIRSERPSRRLGAEGPGPAVLPPAPSCRCRPRDRADGRRQGRRPGAGVGSIRSRRGGDRGRDRDRGRNRGGDQGRGRWPGPVWVAGGGWVASSDFLLPSPSAIVPARRRRT